MVDTYYENTILVGRRITSACLIIFFKLLSARD